MIKTSQHKVKLNWFCWKIGMFSDGFFLAIEEKFHGSSQKNTKPYKGQKYEIGFRIRNTDLLNFDNQWWNLYSQSFEYSLSCIMPSKKNSSGILLPKLFWPTMRKNCSCDREKVLKFEAEGEEFAKFWDH